MYVNEQHAYSVHGGMKRILGILELELLKFSCYQLGASMYTDPLEKQLVLLATSHLSKFLWLF